MPSPNEVFTGLISSTYQNYRRKFADNIAKNNALLQYLSKPGKVDKLTGGRSIVVPIEYAQNGTYTRYSGFDVLDTTQTDPFTSAEFAWKQIAVTITASGLELRTNAGKEAIIKLAQAKLKNAMTSAKNNFSADIYGDGTLPNQISGLQAIVSDTGLGTVGGIDSSAWPFWQSRVQSAAAPLNGAAPVTVSATTIEGLMLPLWLAVTIGNDSPDVIIADANYFSFFENSQVSLKRYTDADTAKGGFLSLMYKGAKVIYDGGSGIANNRMYFINTDHVGLTVHSAADWEMLESVRSANQDGTTTPIVWQGNVTCDKRSALGVLKP